MNKTELIEINFQEAKSKLNQHSNEDLIKLINKLWQNWFKGFAKVDCDLTIKNKLPTLCGINFEQLKNNIEYFSSIEEKDLFEIQEKLKTKSHYPQTSKLNLFFGASTIPITPFVEVLYSLLLRTPIICRIPENYSLDFYKHFEQKIPLELKDTICFAHWNSNDSATTIEYIEASECVIVHGSDQTVKHFLDLADKKTFLGFGHKASLAIISNFHNNSNNFNYEDLVSDIYSFNQLGCLSPQSIYLIGFSEDEKLKFAKELANRLNKKNFYLNPADSFKKQAFLEDVCLNKNVQIFEDKIILDKSSNQFEYSCGFGTIWIKSTNSLKELDSATKNLNNRIACIGQNLNETELSKLDKTFPNTRICNIGEMQNPSLMWLQEPTKYKEALRP